MNKGTLRNRLATGEICGLNPASMKRFFKRLAQLVGILALVLVALLVALHWYQPKLHPVVLPEPKPVSGAAVFYNQAFAAMPELNAKEKEVIVSKEPDLTVARAILAKCDACLQLLAQGADSAECEWGLDYTKGPGMKVTHCTKSLVSCQVLGMRARLHLINGEAPAAVEDILLILRLSRHVGQAPVLIVRLVEMSEDLIAINLTVRNLQKFDSASLQRISEGVAKLPAPLSMKEVMAAETANWSACFNNMMTNQLLAATRSSKTPPSSSQGGKEKNVFQFETPNQEYKITGGLPVKYLAYSLKQYELKSREVERLMELPFPEARPQIDAFEKSLQKHRWINGMYVALALPAMLGARTKEVQVDAAWEILRTALNAQLRDPASVRQALAPLRDPYDDQPFVMRDVEGGVEIQLKTDPGKRPVTLTVGLAGK